MMIPTAVGEVKREDLQVSFDITEEENNFIVLCKWHKDNELVRQDVWVNSKCGLTVGTEQGQLGG